MQCIETCPQEMRGHLLQNIVVAGGCSSIHGFEQRVRLELIAELARTCFPNEALREQGEEALGDRVRVMAAAVSSATMRDGAVNCDARDAAAGFATVGGALQLLSLPRAVKWFVTSAEYDARGPAVVSSYFW